MEMKCDLMWSLTSGPVRGIDFHKQQPLFVSGGDDYKIKVGLLWHQDSLNVMKLDKCCSSAYFCIYLV